MKTQIGNPASKLKLSLLLGGLALSPALAQAHHIPGTLGGFAGGLSHPLAGLDHLLAMVAVGVWAAQLGGRAMWRVPAAFVAVMALGGILGLARMPLPGVEAGVAVSVLALGLLIATAVRLPLVASMGLVGVFALFHGHAHGTEMPAGAQGLAYGLGFVAATAALHACGLALGLLAQKRMAMSTLRFAGAAVALAGLCLWLG